MLKGTFFVDFIAGLPIERIPRISYFKLIGLFKLTRLHRLPNIIARFNFTLLTRTVMRFVNLILFLIIIYHFVNCLWLIVVLHEDQNWIPPVNWIDFHRYSYFQTDGKKQYLVSLYSSQLALNSGQIGPRTTFECAAASAIIFLGMFVNALMFGTMSQLLFSMRKLQRENQVLIDSANTLMGKIALPQNERRKIITYLSSIKVTHQIQLQLSLFEKQIPPTLRFQVRKHIYTEMLHKSKLLQQMIKEDNSEQSLNYLVSQFQTVLSEPEDKLVQYGTDSQQMYFIAQGSALVLWRNLSEQTFKKLSILKQGAHFGEIGLIYNCKRTMTVETYKYSLFARLSRQNFNTLNFSYEDIFKPGIREYKDKYKKNIETVLGRLPLFRGLSGDEINRIVFAFDNRAIPNQSYAFKEEDKQEGLYIIQSGFMLLSMKVEGMRVPLKSLKKGFVVGYDQIFYPSVHRVSGQCLNYTLVGDNSKRDTCFKEIETPQTYRRKALKTPNIKLTQVEEEIPASTRRELLGDKRRGGVQSVDLKRKLSGLGITPRKPAQDIKMLHPTLHIEKKGKKERTVHLQAVVSFLSNKKIKQFLEEMPALSYNYAQEMRRVNLSGIRPYPLDYYIPKRGDSYQGGRDAWFKVQNAIIHTVIKKRQERKTMTLFDRVYEAVTKERAIDRSSTTIDKIKMNETLHPTKNSSFHSPSTQSSNVINSFQGFLKDVEKIVIKSQKNVERIMKGLNFLEYMNSQGTPTKIQDIEEPHSPILISEESADSFSEMLENMKKESSFQIPLDTGNDIEDVIAAYERNQEQKKH